MNCVFASRLLLMFLGILPFLLPAQPTAGAFSPEHNITYDSLIRKNIQVGIIQHQRKDYSHALQTFLSVYEYVETVPDTATVKWAYYKHLADLMATIGATDLCIEFSKNAYFFSKKRSAEPSVSLYQRAGSIGAKYTELKQFDSAAVYLQESLRITEQLNNPVYLSAAYNNLGILEEQTGNVKALQYYLRALSCVSADSLEQDALFGSIHDNLAGWHLNHGNYPSALKHCQQINEWLLRTRRFDLHRSAKTMLKETAIWDKTGKTPEAISKLLENRDLYERVNIPDLQLEYYHNLTEMLKREKRFEEMVVVMNAANTFADSLSARQLRLAKLAIEGVTQVRTSTIRRDLENLELKSRQQALILEKEQQSARYRGLWLLFMLFAVSAILILGYLFYSRKAKKLEMEIIQKELTEARLLNEYLEKERLATVLESKEKDLSGLVMYISQVREWQSSLLESMESIEPGTNKEALPVLRKMMGDLRSRLQTDERLKIFQDNIEVLDRRFFAQLRDKHPRLTTEDLHLCGCFRLNMSAKDIASMRGISLKSINMSRYRLRKKLGLKPEEDLNFYLQNL